MSKDRFRIDRDGNAFDGNKQISSSPVVAGLALAFSANRLHEENIDLEKMLSEAHKEIAELRKAKEPKPKIDKPSIHFGWGDGREGYGD